MEYTNEDIDRAREYAAKINRELADSAFDPDFGFAAHVTDADKTEYAKQQRKLAEEIEQGEHDHNLTVAQRMHFFLTGDCVPILP